MVMETDRSLLARFRLGSADALEQLLERYEKELWLFLVGLLRDHHHAEDALQETFVKALENLDVVDPDHFRGWLFTVAYHQGMLLRRRLATVLRRQGLGHGDPDDVPAPDREPWQKLMAQEEAARCRSWLEQLPVHQRIVIQRHVYEGKRFREIAEELACPLGTALARMHQGLKRLRVLGGNDHE